MEWDNTSFYFLQSEYISTFTQFKTVDMGKVISFQWRSMGGWRPGQEVKLSPLVLIFSHKIFKMVNPKQISVIFKSDKKKKIVLSS